MSSNIDHTDRNQGNSYEIAVYYDEARAVSWIDRESAMIVRDTIRDFYPKTIFLNAYELKYWFKERRKNNDANKCVLIFSQDIVPDTIYDKIDPNIPPRRFLESGGIIIWIGDEPFYYRGRPEKEVDRLGESACYSILGVLTFFLHSPKEYTKIVNENFKKLLTHKWFGLRPIIKERKGGLIKKGTITRIGISESNYLFKLPFSETEFIGPKTKEEEPFIGTRREEERSNERTEGIEEEPTQFSIGGISFSISEYIKRHLIRMKIGIPLLSISLLFGWMFFNRIKNSILALPLNVFSSIFFPLFIVSILLIYRKYKHDNETYDNAWVKSFQNGKFVRIWDYPIREITNHMKHDLCELIKYFLEK